MPLPNLILFDGSFRNQLLPFTFTRPAADIRCGIFTIREKWENYLWSPSHSISATHLSDKYPANISDDNLLVRGNLIPDKRLIWEISDLKPGQYLWHEQTLLAARLDRLETQSFDPEKKGTKSKLLYYDDPIVLITRPYEIFSLNEQEISRDYQNITFGRESTPPGHSVNLIGENIFIEKGANVQASVINSTTGPVYIGKDAEIMEGCLIRGPLALGEGAVLKMGTKIYGPTTIGPFSKVGGEVNNSVIFGYSNKAHDGFLGNAVIGEWCNLGADTNNSNLKNNYAEVRLWDYPSGSFIPTGLQFCGLMMGDHSKCGINTMFNTGTVVGVSANIFGSGFPRNFIPSFSWGGAGRMKEYALPKALEVARAVMSRRGIEMSKVEENILKDVFEISAQFRRF